MVTKDLHLQQQRKKRWLTAMEIVIASVSSDIDSSNGDDKSDLSKVVHALAVNIESSQEMAES